MAIIHVDQNSFAQQVLQAGGPVLVDFWADWCGPCKMIAPVLGEIAAAYPELTIAKVNVDSDPQLAIQYGVTGIPTLLLFRGGEVTEKAVGYREKAELIQMLHL